MNTHAPKDPVADQFVRELITTAFTFMDAISSLIESFEEGEQPWPGEETGEVLIEMAAGSIRPALKAMSDAEIDRTVELIAAVRERFMGDLRLAAEMAGRRENGWRG